ncbi:hypothetical protein HK101_004435, partial [Irineochytrium annulatum]
MIQIGSTSYSRSTSEDVLPILSEYTTVNASTLASVHLRVDQVGCVIPENIPLVNLELKLPKKLRVLDFRKFRGIDDVASIDVLSELEEVEVLAVDNIESDNELLMNAFSYMPSLRRLHLRITDHKKVRKLLAELHDIDGLE